MVKIVVLFLGIFLSCNLVISQTQTEHWESYIASYEGGKPGSTMVRMDLINSAPLYRIQLRFSFWDNLRKRKRRWFSKR